MLALHSYAKNQLLRKLENTVFQIRELHCQPGWYIWSTFPYNSHTKLSYITCALNPHESELSWRSFSMNCVLYTKFVCGFFFSLLNSLILFLLLFYFVFLIFAVHDPFFEISFLPRIQILKPQSIHNFYYFSVCVGMCVFFFSGVVVAGRYLLAHLHFAQLRDSNRNYNCKVFCLCGTAHILAHTNCKL